MKKMNDNEQSFLDENFFYELFAILYSINE